MDEEKDLSSASLADEFADKDLQGLAGVIREMREASGLDKEANTREPVRHFKRLGRELAMQFLYQCEIAGSEDFVENLDNFWSQAELSGKFVEGRVFRKGRAYAEKHLPSDLLHTQINLRKRFCRDRNSGQILPVQPCRYPARPKQSQVSHLTDQP